MLTVAKEPGIQSEHVLKQVCMDMYVPCPSNACPILGVVARDLRVVHE